MDRVGGKPRIRCPLETRGLFAAILALALASCNGAGGRSLFAVPDDVGGPFDRFLVGAAYYVWFPENFDQGYLREKLDPPQQLTLGCYDSRDAHVAEQHIAWSSRYGIDFLALSWWPGRADQNARIQENFLAAPNIADIRFCLLYETIGLGYNADLGAMVFTEETTQTFLADLVPAAEALFNHPSYLRIGGRPVVYFYVTRSLAGDYAGAFERFRAELAARGYDPYFVGDEVFWQVVATKGPTNAGSGGDGEPAATTVSAEPQLTRIRLFDAITSYNMYESARPGHAGYGAESVFVRDVGRKYEEYVEATWEEDVAFVPGIMPGYNDRGVRPDQDHYAIPRQWEPGGTGGSFLAQAFDRLAFPYLDPRVNMILVTSWNEWNEDTGIEPLNPSDPTNRDASGTGDLYTQGYPYAGDGTATLEVVRDKVVAVAGRVVDAAGAAVPGVTVCAWRKGREAATACDVADAWGYYTLSRRTLKKGSCEVGIEGQAARVPVRVEADRAMAEIDILY